MSVSAACDFFTVPTLTFKVRYVFIGTASTASRSRSARRRSAFERSAGAREFQAFELKSPNLLHQDTNRLYRGWAPLIVIVI